MGYDGMTPELKLELLGWIARTMGLWYIFTGATAINAWRRNATVGREVAASVAAAPDHIAQLRSWTVLAVGTLTSLSGLTLAFLSNLAPVFFLACCSVQGAYFAWARTALPPVDEAGRKARQISQNAFAMFAASTLFVLGCRTIGVLS